MQVPIIKLRQSVPFLWSLLIYCPGKILPHVYTPPQDWHTMALGIRATLHSKGTLYFIYSRIRWWPFEICSKLLRGTPKFIVSLLIWKVISRKQSQAKLPSMLICVWVAVINNFRIRSQAEVDGKDFRYSFGWLTACFDEKKKKMDEGIQRDL